MSNPNARCEECDQLNCTCTCEICGILKFDCMGCGQTDFHKMIDNVKTLFMMQGGTEQERNNELQKHFFIMYRNSNG